MVPTSDIVTRFSTKGIANAYDARRIGRMARNCEERIVSLRGAYQTRKALELVLGFRTGEVLSV